MRHIAAYEKSEEKSSAVEWQFYLTMKAKLMQWQGKEAKDICAVYREALRLTVPDEGQNGLSGRLLAAKEWNLVLECIYFEEKIQKKEPYETLLGYMMQGGMDTSGRGFIYPKTIYYLCRELMQEPEENWECEEILAQCGKALELLRNTERTYYLYELLQVRKRTASVLAARFLQEREIQKAAVLKHLQEETEIWQCAYAGACEKCGVSPQTEHDCNLYMQSETYCIGEVVRARRKMLGLTKKQLCDGICSEKTLQRMENGRMRTQMAVVRQLFERLGLPPEYQRREIITNSYDAVVLFDEIKKALNNGEKAKAESLLAELNGMLCMEIPNNRQEIKRLESLLRWKGEQNRAQCIVGLKEALEYTVSLDTVMAAKEWYLTCTEWSCLYNMMTQMPEQDAEPYVRLLENVYTGYTAENGIGAYIGRYELSMDGVASYWGNVKAFDRSDEISRTLMRESLLRGRMNMLHKCLYNIWWNHEERIKLGLPADTDFDAGEELQNCIVLSRLCKRKRYEKHYRSKLETQKEP
jgi:transcriptional regulator with XRE-family HTH domain